VGKKSELALIKRGYPNGKEEKVQNFITYE
jgi:hypothetical protein